MMKLRKMDWCGMWYAWAENLQVRDHLGYLGVNRRIILKWILKNIIHVWGPNYILLV
jgi:hypothetical protein